MPIEPGGARELAARSRGTPRVANRLLRRARDFAEVLGTGSITAAIAKTTADRLEVDAAGLDEMDRRLLLVIIEHYDGGPVGIDTLAAALSEPRDTIEDVYEPFLLQQGFLGRTPRGRIATRKAYEHLGRPASGAGAEARRPVLLTRPLPWRSASVERRPGRPVSGSRRERAGSEFVLLSTPEDG